jgi:hypothetical protein
MKRWMTALGTLAVTTTSTGCAVVLDPVQQDPAPPDTPHAIAILSQDLAYPKTARDTSAYPGGPSQYVPDTLMLMWSNEAEQCGGPLIHNCSDHFEWQGDLLLPPDLVRVGLVDLDNPRIISFSIQYPGGCSADSDWMSGYGGTMEIVSLDATSITVNLQNPIENWPAGNVSVDGEVIPPVQLKGSYTLPLCDAAPTPPPPHAAVAIRGADLPSGLLASPTIGASPDPTALYVFVGTGIESCADPEAPLACNPNWENNAYDHLGGRLVLRIPEALQQPGTLDLSDPRLATSVETVSVPPSCTSSTLSSFTRGTLTITNIDASGISFSLFQSLAPALTSDARFDADGLYEATICP